MKDYRLYEIGDKVLLKGAVIESRVKSEGITYVVNIADTNEHTIGTSRNMYENPMDVFSDQELIDELKRRGVITSPNGII